MFAIMCALVCVLVKKDTFLGHGCFSLREKSLIINPNSFVA